MTINLSATEEVIVIKDVHLWYGEFEALKGVSLAGTSVSSVKQFNASRVVVVAAASVAVAGNVVLTADSGAIVPGVGAWTYSEPGEIQTVIPDHGQHGTFVNGRAVTTSELKPGDLLSVGLSIFFVQYECESAAMGASREAVV